LAPRLSCSTWWFCHTSAALVPRPGRLAPLRQPSAITDALVLHAGRWDPRRTYRKRRCGTDVRAWSTSPGAVWREDHNQDPHWCMYSSLACVLPSLTVRAAVARLCTLRASGPTERSDSGKEPRDPRKVCQACGEPHAPILSREFLSQCWL
jgi:hypothetical protein